MEVERLEVAQLEQVLLDSLQVVVGKIKPEKVLEGVAHHNLGEHGGQSPELAQLVVLQEKSRGRLLNHDLLLSFRLGLFDLTATHGTLLVSQRDVVVDKDLLQLGRLRRADNFLLLHGGLYILLCVFFVRGSTTVLILSQKRPITLNYAAERRPEKDQSFSLTFLASSSSSVWMI